MYLTVCPFALWTWWAISALFFLIVGHYPLMSLTFFNHLFNSNILVSCILTVFLISRVADFEWTLWQQYYTTCIILILSGNMLRVHFFQDFKATRLQKMFLRENRHDLIRNMVTIQIWLNYQHFKRFISFNYHNWCTPFFAVSQCIGYKWNICQIQLKYKGSADSPILQIPGTTNLHYF